MPRPAKREIIDEILTLLGHVSRRDASGKRVDVFLGLFEVRKRELEAILGALRSRLAAYAHTWRLAPSTTPSGKVVYECEACGIEAPAPVRLEFETRPCVPELKQLRHLVGRLAQLLRECRMYRGYGHGPAVQPAVDFLLEQAKWVLASPDASRSTSREDTPSEHEPAGQNASVRSVLQLLDAACEHMKDCGGREADPALFAEAIRQIREARRAVDAFFERYAVGAGGNPPE